ncbi:MAG: hypothetical protein ACI8SE_001000 [Bacteroidia bacterium]|jgi:uncharacterized protein YndB with AHSA1/START domain
MQRIQTVMNKELVARESIIINASADAIWEVLTNPEQIKKYLFGTETITDWHVGSTILFQGSYDGHDYKDKGNVLVNEPKTLLQYDYWSGFSGLPDSPENYSIVTYQIDREYDTCSNFTWGQEGFSSETGQQHAQGGLMGMLEQIKQIAEA